MTMHYVSTTLGDFTFWLKTFAEHKLTYLDQSLDSAKVSTIRWVQSSYLDQSWAELTQLKSVRFAWKRKLQPLRLNFCWA